MSNIYSKRDQNSSAYIRIAEDSIFIQERFFENFPTDSNFCRTLNMKKCELSTENSCIFSCEYKGRCLKFVTDDGHSLQKPLGISCNEDRGICMPNGKCERKFHFLLMNKNWLFFEPTLAVSFMICYPFLLFFGFVLGKFINYSMGLF